MPFAYFTCVCNRVLGVSERFLLRNSMVMSFVSCSGRMHEAISSTWDISPISFHMVFALILLLFPGSVPSLRFASISVPQAMVLAAEMSLGSWTPRFFTVVGSVDIPV